MKRMLRALEQGSYKENIPKKRMFFEKDIF